MKHLSIRSTEVPQNFIRNMTCLYTMGDEFVETLAEVDCPSCLKQINTLKL